MLAAWVKSRVISLSGFVLLFTASAIAQTNPPTNWSGFYVGGNAGYSWASASRDSLNISGSQYTNFVEPFLNPTASVSAPAQKEQMNGGIWGGQLGYNFQSSRWVIGVESDLQYSRKSGALNSTNAFQSTTCFNGTLNPGGMSCSASGPASYTASTALESRIDWFGTSRGRFGWLLTDQLMAYGTAGLAYGKVGFSGNTQVSGTFTTASGANGRVSDGFGLLAAQGTSLGFVVGGGLEGKFSFAPRWSWKAEYLYMDFGSLAAAASFSAASNWTSFSSLSGSATTSVSLVQNLVRFGINYSF